MFTILMFFGALPYFVLFHVGFISFFIFLISNLVNRRFGVRFTKVKLIACLYGIAGGLLLPFMEAHYALRGTLRFTSFFNLPALFTVVILPFEGRFAEYHWQFYVIYGAYGLLGGWGLGQLIDWFRERRNK